MCVRQQARLWCLEINCLSSLIGLILRDVGAAVLPINNTLTHACINRDGQASINT